MAAPKQESPESALEVLEFTQASELCQAMEARGDFKFKGIFSVFTTIQEWTQRFSSNGILPTEEQIARDSSVPADRVKDYLMELIGRGQSKTRLVSYFPAVDYVAGPHPGIIKMTVYCRPAKSDATSSSRYATALAEKSQKVVAKWLETRKSVSQEELNELLLARIEEGRLQDTQPGAEVARLFYTDLDITAEQRKNAYTIHARPVIQKLIASRHLLLLQDGNDRAIYFNRKDEIESRYTILARYFLTRMAGKGSELESDKQAVRKLASSFTVSEATPAGQRQLLRELKVLPPLVEKLNKDEHEKKRKADQDQVITDISKLPRVVELDRIKGMNEEVRTAVLSSASLLRTEYPMNGKLTTFVLHRDALLPALKTARDSFDTRGDVVDVRILSAMGIERFLPHDHLKSFQDLEQRTLFPRLPFFVRLWRLLFGSSKMKPEEVAKLKQGIERENTDERLRIQRAEADKAKKKLAAERMKGEAPKEEESPAERPHPVETAEADIDPEAALAERTVDDLKAEETLRNMVIELDKQWDDKKLPNRTSLIEKFPEFNEDTLITFLKKYGRKEILSFRIHNEKPEYVWPILITRRYIRAKGNAMRKKYMAEADEQRKASMPNQEKFDVASSIEDFLNRAMTKVN